MSVNRAAALAAVIAVIAAALFSSCLPPPPPRLTPFWERWLDRMDRTVTYTVVDECRLIDEAGSDVERIAVAPSTPICWSNRSSLTAVIEFSHYEIVGQWSILVNPGESRTTTLRSSLDPDEEYSVRVLCKGVEVIEGPTPPIEEEEPPLP